MASLNPSPGLSLEFKPLFIPKTISQFLAGVSRISSVTDKVLQFDDFVDRLETETRKIEAFKRELPLCMLLINDAIAALKAESMMLKKSSKAEPVLEEFIPLKNSCDDDYPKVEIITNQKDNGDKKNWLSSTHLWNTNENLRPKLNSVAQKIEKRAEEERAERVVFNGNYRLIPCSMPNVESNIRIGDTTPVPPTSRKRRRSWSTELHRRFVNALQQLGGSQAATPKQIRELMQVDGLTNDEVKSHLQKYRLHTRRIPSPKTNRSSPVVEGGLWMSRSSESHSGSPDGPLLNGENSIDDEEDEQSENYSCNANL